MTRVSFPSAYQWRFETTNKDFFLFEHPNTMSGFSEERCFSRFERIEIASPPDGHRFTRIHFGRELAAWCEDNFRGTYMIRYGDPVWRLDGLQAFITSYEVGFDEEADWLFFKLRWS